MLNAKKKFSLHSQLKIQRIDGMKMQSTGHGLQSPKGNAAVTSKWNARLGLRSADHCGNSTAV
jgi:hypothetical protein